jgi:predicted HTH domain antitoxin
MAAKLFETGRLSSTQAAELAGLPKPLFLYELKRFGVSPVQMDADELARDLVHADQAFTGH